MKAKYLVLGFLAIMGVTSCNDYLNLDPTNQATEKPVRSNPDYAEMAVNHFYGDITRLGNYSVYQCYAGMSEGLTGELKYGNMTYNAHMYIPNELSYGGTIISPSYVDVYMGVWENTYIDIRRANEAIANLKKSNFASEIKTRLMAELRFFRGMYYYELMKRYHQVVLYDEDMEKISRDHALCTEQEGWDFVYNDLKFAAENLPVSTVASGRITSGAAYALMTRAMLFCKNWNAVKTAAEKIFTMKYELTDNYADAFRSDNSEAILQFTYNVSEGL